MTDSWHGETFTRPVLDPHSADGSLWAVPLREELVPFNAADAILLLSAASGLVGALVNARSVALAMGVAGAYLRLQSNQASMPITALTYVRCPERSFPGVCLTEALTIHIDRDELDIPMKLIRNIRGASLKVKAWGPRKGATVELIDGSSYKHVKVQNPRLEFLSLIGRQAVDVSKAGVSVQGHTVNELDALRQRLELALERHRAAVERTVGPAIFGQYFRRAA